MQIPRHLLTDSMLVKLPDPEADYAGTWKEARRVATEAQRASNYSQKMAEWERAVLGLTNGICVNDKGQLCVAVRKKA